MLGIRCFATSCRRSEDQSSLYGCETLMTMAVLINHWASIRASAASRILSGGEMMYGLVAASRAGIQ